MILSHGIPFCNCKPLWNRGCKVLMAWVQSASVKKADLKLIADPSLLPLKGSTHG